MTGLAVSLFIVFLAARREIKLQKSVIDGYGEQNYASLKYEKKLREKINELEAEDTGLYVIKSHDTMNMLTYRVHDNIQDAIESARAINGKVYKLSEAEKE